MKGTKVAVVLTLFEIKGFWNLGTQVFENRHSDAANTTIESILLCFIYTGDEDPPSLSPNDWLGEVVDRRGDERSRVFPNLKNAFRTAVEQFGPNDFFVSKHTVQKIALRYMGSLPFRLEIFRLCKNA